MSDNSVAVIWDDEEPVNLRNPIKQFRKKYGWSVDAYKTPRAAYDRIQMMDTSQLEKCVLILDIMMPAPDTDDIFNAKTTSNGVLTGLELGRRIHQSGKLKYCKAVFFYSVLTISEDVAKVNLFVDQVKSDIGIDFKIEFVHNSDVTFGELPRYVSKRLAL